MRSPKYCLPAWLLFVFPVLGMPFAGGLHDAAADESAPVKEPAPVKMVFSHIGLITTEKKPNERYVEATKVWVTDFQKHPYKVEWLRFEPDSPVKGPVREMPHVGYEVDSIEEASKGMKLLLAPFDAGIAVVGFYQTEDGAVIELMKMKRNP